MIRQIECLIDTPFARALEIHQESGTRRETHGNNGFGQLCLVALRPLETGVRFLLRSCRTAEILTSDNLTVTLRLYGWVDQPWATFIDE
ncbi:MAG: hypothetical protein MK110_02685 [Fuerstiella sp.]|nr:hypothetical protein [Fuerstiella sp.]